VTGQVLNGRYELRDKLGEGGMAVVYRGHDLQTGRELAVKVMKPSLAGTAKKRFTREFRAIASMDHPNCLKVYDFGESSDSVFFTMELFDGAPITAVCNQPLPVIFDALFQAASALEYVHARGIVHRDVKPSNLLVRVVADDPAGPPTIQVKLADFGLARFYGLPSSLSVDSGFVGTLEYCAPEQISNGQVDHRADLYSLGLVCYELLCGRHPFDEARKSGIQSLMRAHLSEHPRPLDQMRPDLPPEAVHAVQSLFHKEFTSRPESASGLRRIVASFAGHPVTDDDPSLSAIGPASQAVEGLVGRETEMADVRAAMQETLTPPPLTKKQGSFHPVPSIVFLRGEAGIGKSRTTQEVVRLGRRQNAVVYEGRCFEGNLAPYQPFVEILRQLLSGRSPAERSEPHSDHKLFAAGRDAGSAGDGADPGLTTALGSGAKSSLHDVVADFSAELLRIAPDLRKWLPGEAMKQVDLSREANYVLRAVATFFIEVSVLQPTCLFIEDLQWADQSTLDLLRHLASELSRSRERCAETNAGFPRLFIFCNTRPGDRNVEQFMVELHRKQYARFIDLQPLTEDAVRQLTAHVLGGQEDQITPALIGHVYRRCQGNPLFVGESVREWRRTGKIVFMRGIWSLSANPDSGSEWPDSVRGVLQSRMQDLSANARQLLWTAAVIGPVIDVDLLRATVDDLGDNPFLDAVDELLAHKVVVESAGALRLEFAHDLIRELAYAELTGSRRNALHRKVGEILEKEADRFNCSPEVLAAHFGEAGVRLKAFSYYVTAARAALDSYAVENAIRLCIRAREIAPDDVDGAREYRLYELLATALGAAGRPAEAIEYFEKSRRYAADPLQKARLTERIGELHFQVGDLDQALAYFDEALEQSGHRRARSLAGALLGTTVSFVVDSVPRSLRFRNSPEGGARTAAEIAHDAFAHLNFLFARRNIIRCAHAGSRQLALAHRIGDPRFLAYAYSRHTAVFGIFSLYSLALRAAGKALAHAEKCNDNEVAAIGRGHVGCAHFFGGDLPEAERLLRSSLEVLDRRGDWWYRLFFYHNLRHVYSILGDVDREISCARTEMQIGEVVRDSDGTCWGSYGIANALARSGRLDEAFQYIERALGIIAGKTDIIVVPTCLQTYGFVHLQAGDFKAAREVLEGARSMVERNFAFVDYVIRLYPLLVESILGPRWHSQPDSVSTSDRSLAWKIGRRAQFWGWRFPNYRAHALRVRGRAAFAVGKTAKAVGFFQKSIEVARTTNARYDEARACLDLATICDNASGAEQGRHGQAILTDLGAALPLDQAVRASPRSGESSSAEPK